jgi:hypothetical protein
VSGRRLENVRTSGNWARSSSMMAAGLELWLMEVLALCKDGMVGPSGCWSCSHCGEVERGDLYRSN